MTRADYMALRSALRKAQHKLAGTVRQDEYADSRLMVQMTSQAEQERRLHTRITAIRQQMPWCCDPLGFRAMYSDWKSRRLRVEYRCRARKHDAELRARHEARYGVAA